MNNKKIWENLSNEEFDAIMKDTMGVTHMPVYVKYQLRGESEVKGGELVTRVSYSVFTFKNQSGQIDTIDAKNPIVEKFSCNSCMDGTALESVLACGFPSSNIESKIFGHKY